jgi:L-ascorbate metabolism protein UlaG (beta-lactamase superfamily)
MCMLKVFGQLPKDERYNKIRQSPYYNLGSFKNLVEPKMEVNAKVIWQLMNRPKAVRPSIPIPSIRTDLHRHENPDRFEINWFGHSSYLIRVRHKTILVDPVLSGYASPFSFSTRAFSGSDVYKPEDMPNVDLLILSHDHYDHLDFNTLRAMKPRIRQIICPIGVGAHLEFWGFEKSKITELSWWDSTEIENFRITSTPAQHFSGRLFKRAQSLWSSFVLEDALGRLFLGGDSGYGNHFAEIGEKFGPFDLAILESGQYNDAWSGIHMSPEETVKASLDLKASLLLPVHWGKFTLAMHAWDEPIERVMAEAERLRQRVTTPMIGESILLGERHPDTAWWRNEKN